MLSFGHFGGAAADESESVCSFQSVQLGGASLNAVFLLCEGGYILFETISFGSEAPFLSEMRSFARAALRQSLCPLLTDH